jgi:hypothetical protein
MWGSIVIVGGAVIAVISTIYKWVNNWLSMPKFAYFIDLLSNSNPETLIGGFRIVNKGRTNALNVKVKIGFIYFLDSSSNLDLQLGEIKSLRWRDEGRYEVVRVPPNHSTRWFFGFGASPEYDFDKRDCEIEMIITGDNFPNIKKRLKLISSPRVGEAQLSFIKKSRIKLYSSF